MSFKEDLPEEDAWAPDVPRVNILGVGVSALDLRTATRFLIDAAAGGRKGYVAVCGVHGISEAQNDPAFRSILNASMLTTPDGMPLSWIGWMHGHRSMDRVYGPDLMLAVFSATTSGEVRHFFYGGRPGVAEELKAAMERRFPGVCICGTYSPPFRALDPDEASGLAALISERKPHIIWVGISTPKQERFMAEYLQKLDVSVMVGVGAAFDMHSGRARQAPYWMQRAGLEWLFRMGQEPRRLGRRYLFNNPLFLWRVALQTIGLRRYPIP